MKGRIHIYTGDGKGKTTAAMGLALRAAGRGKSVVIVQFLKGSESGEIITLRQIPSITVFRNKKNYGFFGSMNEDDKAIVTSENNANLYKALGLLDEGACDLLILDEAMAAYALNAVSREDLDQLVLHKPEPLELVLTGREPPAHYLEAADYVSEIRKIKHPFDLGERAREGIEF